MVIERVAAIDVAKAAGKVCMRLPGKPGRRFGRVWDVPARTGAFGGLGERLIEAGIEKVTVESTSDYWRIWYYLLEVTCPSKTGTGNPYLKGALGEAAAAAAKTDTFLGERYRRIVKRRGKLKALVAVARSILVIIWHLLANPTARFHVLGPDYHTD